MSSCSFGDQTAIEATRKWSDLVDPLIAEPLETIHGRRLFIAWSSARVTGASGARTGQNF